MSDVQEQITRLQHDFERVQEQMYGLESRDGATAMAVNLVHDRLNLLARRVDEGFNDTGQRLGRVEGLLRQVLERLPAPGTQD